MRTTAEHYSSVAMFFHWLIAALLIGNICLGLYFSDLPRSDPYLFTLAQIHKSIGLTILVLSVLRVLWRLINPVPPLPSDMPGALKIAARSTQVLLYVLIVIIPLSGWLMVSTSRHVTPIPYFFLFDWPALPNVGNHEFWEDAHTFLAWSAIVLVPLHVLGALYHQFVRRDRVFSTMWPWASRA